MGSLVETSDYSVVFEHGSKVSEGATVAITLYNYDAVILDALESVAKQTLAATSLVVIDDRSTDNSLAVARDWLERNSARFPYALLAQNVANSGLARARNNAVSASATEFVFVLDADNELYPRCLERCLGGLRESDAAFAYPILEVFGAKQGLLGTDAWNKGRLALGNYIDATTLLRKERWAAAGGYSVMPVMGWEDYDLWCKFADRGWWGLRIPEILARYRMHASSMLRTLTNKRKSQQVLVDYMRREHPWVECVP